MAPQQEPSLRYFRFQPEDIFPGAVAHNINIGEVVVGRIYPVRVEQVPQFVGHADWQPANEGGYRAQEKELKEQERLALLAASSPQPPADDKQAFTTQDKE